MRPNRGAGHAAPARELDDNADIVCDALIELAACRPELRVLFPVHPNPRMPPRLRRRLGDHAAFGLVDPMTYPEFIRRAAGAALIISDSGGLQEEAPHLGVPLLVPRANTERPEASRPDSCASSPSTGNDRRARRSAMLAAPRRAPLPFDADAPFGAGDAARAHRRACSSARWRDRPLAADVGPSTRGSGTARPRRERAATSRLARPAAGGARPCIGRALAHWLLNGPAQVGAGPHAGAVAGASTPPGARATSIPRSPATTCSGSRGAAARTEPPARRASPRAGAAQRWLARWLAGVRRRRRESISTATDADWRNGALFCFDVAMVLRGLAAAARERLLGPIPRGRGARRAAAQR